MATPLARIREMLDQGVPVATIAELAGCSRSHVYAVRDERVMDTHLDTSGERCTCGLRVDKDHAPETCDLRSVLGRRRDRAVWPDHMVRG